MRSSSSVEFRSPRFTEADRIRCESVVYFQNVSSIKPVASRTSIFVPSMTGLAKVDALRHFVTPLDRKRRRATFRDDQVRAVSQKDYVLRREQQRSVLAFSAFRRPAHRAGLRVDRKKLSLLLRRVTIDQTVAKNRRAHVHRDVGILPGSRSPATCRRFASSAKRVFLVVCRRRQMSAGPEWRGDVLVPFVGKRHRPHSLPVLPSRPTIEPSVIVTIC